MLAIPAVPIRPFGPTYGTSQHDPSGGEIVSVIQPVAAIQNRRHAVGAAFWAGGRGSAGDRVGFGRNCFAHASELPAPGDQVGRRAGRGGRSEAQRVRPTEELQEPSDDELPIK